MKKRILSLTIMVIMLVNILPAIPFSTSAATPVAKVGSTEYATIDEAIAAWTAGTTLTLLADVTLSDVIVLKSTEHHTLDLSTFTMTAATDKNAIEITSNGFANRTERTALTIKADATNPGGINAGSKACVYYKYDSVLASNKYDRPVIVINGGVFTSTANGFSFAGDTTAQDKCATLQIYGGTFNCDINLNTRFVSPEYPFGERNRTKLLITGGTFNGTLGYLGGSTASGTIKGGTFKSWDTLSVDGSHQFAVGTKGANKNTLGTYDIGLYVRSDGYLVVGGSVITAPSAQFEASSPATNWHSALQYSSAKQYGSNGSYTNNVLYWESIETAMSKKPTGTITVYVSELDLTDSNFTGTLLLPESNSNVVIKFDEATTPTWKVKPVGTLDDTMMAVYTDSASSGTVSRTYKLVPIRTVTFDSQGGTSVDAKEVADGYTVDIPTEPTRNGYTFTGWYKDSACTEGNEWSFDTPVTSNITLYAKWMHSVTFDYGITNVPAVEKNVDHGAIIESTHPVFDGYIFMGWYKENTFENVFDFSAPIEINTTVYGKFADYEGDKEEINNKIQQHISDVNNAINALEDSLGDTTSLTGTIVENITKLQTSIDTLNANYATADTVLQVQITALNEEVTKLIDETIAKLTERVTKLETDLNTANGKIDTNSSDIATLETDVEALKSWKTEAQAAIDSLESLSATKEELEAAVTDLKAALKTANDNISAAIKRIEALEGKVEDLEKDKDALEKAVAELKAAMTSSNEALAKEIKDLNAALEAAKKSASDVDAELKKAIEDSEAALTAAVDELKKRVASIESVLDTANKNINTNTTDIATLKASIKTIELLQSEAEKTIKSLETLIGTNTANITGLQESVTKLQKSIYDADGKIAAAEARIAVLEGKVEELEGVKNELLASVANLQNALANKADRAMVNSAVASLQGSIFALQSAQNNYVAADTALKNELTAAINAAKELAISTAKDLVSQSATELQAAIDKKADSATLEAKVGELAEAIALAETTSKAYADAQDALLKEALDAELLAANELINSLGIRMTDAEAAINALESAVEALQKVTADDAQALKDAVASLSQALADAKALAAESDTALETALGLVISEAQKALEAKISDVQSGLNKAIKDLKAADASNADELKKAIKSIEDAMAAAESARSAADGALESKLTEAQNELTRKIAEVQANLDTAKTELGKAIESGDNSLGEKIKELNEALEAAKAATEASDVSLKNELTAKIDEADAAIYALIEKLRKELQESNVELNTAIEEGDDELNTQFIVSTSVAGVGVAGNIGLLAWIVISKKRRLF